jgi:hypothetical protein
MRAIRWLALASACLAAPPAPEAPPEVRVRIGRGVNLLRGEFAVEWEPARGADGKPHAEYQFRTVPSGACMFMGLQPGYGGYYTGRFDGPPYRAKAECKCRVSYEVMVATAPAGPAAPRSEWTSVGRRVLVPCGRN